MQSRRVVSVATTLKRGKSQGQLQRQGTENNFKVLGRSGRELNRQDTNASISPRDENTGNEGLAKQQKEVKPLTEAELREQLFQRDKDLRAVNNRVERLQMILDKRHTDNLMTVEDIGNKGLKKEREADQFLHLVEQRIETGFRYSSCVALTLFVTIYVIALAMQLQVHPRFSIENPVLNTLVGDLDLETRSLRSSDDIYEWMSSQLVENIFQDPVCGDGICEAPEEYAGFGRFGCHLDCGRFLNTTTVSVKMSHFAAMSGQVGWDLSRVRRGIDPGFRFNVYSHTMGDYLFAEDQTPNGTTLVLDLPDGEYDVRLYQTNVVSTQVDDATTFDTLSVLPSTLPVREAGNDFSYGDRREALAAAALFLRQIQDHCWGGNLLNFDFNCLEYPDADTLIKLLGSYGVSGEVTTSTVPRQSETLATVKFCGAVPDGLSGLRNSSNKDALKAAGTPCGRRRRHHDSWEESIDQGDDADEAQEEEGWNTGIVHEKRKRGMDTQEATMNVGRDDIALGSTASDHARRLLQFSGREGPCVWHDMCDQTVIDRILGQPGMFCAAAGYCDTCSFCQNDATDSVDGACPLATCPQSGGMPTCLDASVLTESWSCPSSIPFEVRTFSEPGDTVSVKPPPVDKIRFFTPSNRLVGSVVVSQRRQRKGVCRGIANEDVQELVSTEGCMEGTDASPFGFDSMFVPTSAIYDGKLNAADHFLPSERTNATKLASTPNGGSVQVTELSVPFGFFAHQHDSSTGGERPGELVHPDHQDSFLVFFDSRLSREQAQTMHTFMVSGMFLSAHTKEVKIAVPTFNADLNLFSLATLQFDWMVGGRMFWDFSLQSFSVDPYEGADGGVQMSFEIAAVAMLVLNICLELWDIVYHIRTMTLGEYFFAGGNLIDWSHMALSVYAWVLWLHHLRLTSSFKIQPAYSVLFDPVASQRPLLTNQTEELAMLRLVSDLESVSRSFSLYSAVAGVVVVLSIVRVIKALDFHPRLAIVTRCIALATTDLFHFLLLSGMVHLGYAAAGALLFGHQFEGFSTIELACQTLTMALLTMDRTQFYPQMNHAAPEWAFHIYLWTFMVISYLLLINMFLSILVDSYVNAKQELPLSLPIPEEVWGLLVHAWKALTAPKKRFLSDWALRDKLEQRKQGLPSTLALRDAVLTTVDLDFSIHLPGGLVVTPKALSKLVDDTPTDQEAETKPQPPPLQHPNDDDETAEGGGVDDGDSSEDDNGWEGGIDGRVRDLLDRYGRYKGSGALDDKEERALLEVLEKEDLEIQILHHQRQSALLPGMERSRILLDRLVPRITTDVTAAGQPPPKPVLKRDDTLSELPEEDEDDSDDDDDDDSPLPAGEGGEGTEKEREEERRVREERRVWLEVTILEGEELPVTDKLGGTDAVYCAVTMADKIGEELYREHAARTRAVQKSARWSWDERVVVKAKKLLPGEEEKYLTVMVMGEQGSLAEGVLGVVQVNVHALVQGTVIRRPSLVHAPAIERVPGPEPVATAEGTEEAGIVTEVEGWYKVVNTHRPKEEMENARLHLRVRPWRPPAGADGVDESGMDSARDTDRSHHHHEEGEGDEKGHQRRCCVM